MLSLSNRTLISMLLIVFIFGIKNSISATTYVSISNGDAETASNWSPKSNPFANGHKLNVNDVVIINHKMTFNEDLKIQGQLTINTNGQLKGGSKSLKIGNNTSFGMVTNYGSIEAKEIELKGKKNSSTSPNLYNYGSIITQKITVENKNSEELINYSTGLITINTAKGNSKGELNIQNRIQNCGSLIVEKEVIIDGGEIECGGDIMTPLVEFDKNGSKKGKLTNTNICNSNGSSSSDFKEKGENTYSSLLKFVQAENLGSGNNLVYGSKFQIDSTSVFDCGMSLDQSASNGGGNPLLVQLIYFKGELANRSVILIWETSSELNNKKFVIERTFNGQLWSNVIELNGAGTTNEPQFYELIDDIDGAPSTIYYRLSQVDHDGVVTYFPIIEIANYNENNQADTELEEPKINIYPNLTRGLLHINYSDGTAIDGVFVVNQNGGIIEVTTTIENNEIVLNFEGNPPGTYSIKILSGGKYQYRRVIYMP